MHCGINKMSANSQFAFSNEFFHFVSIHAYNQIQLRASLLHNEVHVRLKMYLYIFVKKGQCKEKVKMKTFSKHGRQ